ncbi:unnamed protein product [Darwinula stevensoni]|uniref:XK-related protein n=1 Tax=Darwinula stevensoni TaxID=69355 RepID=A0A7R9AEM8_9CRUS|nr:unnamed protein product [Darwinula stevensoni]CAG0902471.1 unnamed protein product [Darwinula stevensoni]
MKARMENPLRQLRRRRAQRRRNPERYLGKSIWEAFLLVLAIVLYLGDVGSDIWAAYRYCVDEEYFFFGMTIGIVMFAWLFVFAVDMFQYFYALQDVCQYWCSGCKTTRWRDCHNYDNIDSQTLMASSLRLVEAYLESGPQMVLQFYIIVHDGATFAGNPLTFAAQRLSIVTSLLGVASATYSYYSHSIKYCVKDVRHKDEIDRDSSIITTLELDLGDKILLFFWHLGIISARVLALGLFATAFSWWVFVVVGIHMSIVALWAILKEKTSLCFRPQTFLFKVVASFVYVFQYFNSGAAYGMGLGWDWAYMMKPYKLMYVLMAIENVVMLTLWSFSVVDVWLWYKILIYLFLDLEFFIIGIVSMLMFQRCVQNKMEPNAYFSCSVPLYARKIQINDVL